MSDLRYFQWMNSNEILKEPPAEGIEVNNQGHWTAQTWDKLKENPEVFDKDKKYYYCRFCDGYIWGSPEERGENTLRILSGRRGHSYRCIRCKQELSFSGVIA